MNSPPLLSYACPIDWTKMSGTDRVRFCEACGRHVQNLSLLSDAERSALIKRARTERVCGSYWVRLTGELVTPANPLSPREKSSVRQFGTALLSAGALAIASGCVSQPATDPSPSPPVATVAPSVEAGGDEEIVLLTGFICEISPSEQHGPSSKRR
jgi:hypothetical protein